MDENTLNERLTAIADMEEYPVKGLEGTGKALPYYGWFWRRVHKYPDDNCDVDLRIGEDGCVWIVQNDKWGLNPVNTTKAERLAIYEMLVAIAEHPTIENLQAFYDHLQTFASR